QRSPAKWRRRLPTESNIWQPLITNIKAPFRCSGTLKKTKAQRALFHEALSKLRRQEPVRHDVTAHGTRVCKCGAVQAWHGESLCSRIHGLRTPIDARP